MPAWYDRLYRYAVTFLNVPKLGGLRPYTINEAHDFVAWNDRNSPSPILPMTQPLLVVRPAESASFDTQDCVVIADFRNGKLAKLKIFRALEHSRQCVGHHQPPLANFGATS